MFMHFSRNKNDTTAQQNIFVSDKRDSNKVVIASRPSVRFERYDKSFPLDLFF